MTSDSSPPPHIRKPRQRTPDPSTLSLLLKRPNNPKQNGGVHPAASNLPPPPRPPGFPPLFLAALELADERQAELELLHLVGGLCQGI